VDEKKVNIHYAKTNLSRLLMQVKEGREVIIANNGVPVARLVPYASKPAKRVPGSAKGQVAISPDFDDPLPRDILESFEQ
jgi:prevent-host-death family protein